MFRRFCLLVLAFSLNVFIQAQEQFITGGDDNGTNLNVLYRNDACGKIYVNPRGLGVLYRQSKHVTVKTRSFYELDIQSLKDPKEVKIQGTAPTKRRFIYGKLNNVLLVRGALGLQNVIFSKADIKAVEVRYSYSLGPSLAFAKPYYVQVNRKAGAGVTSQYEIEKFNSDSFTQDSVIGRGGFIYGLNQIKVYPAFSAKFNLSFEYAPYTNLIRAIETGVSLDYFPKALPIMARNPVENLIFTFHIGFVFGQKWY